MEKAIVFATLFLLTTGCTTSGQKIKSMKQYSNPDEMVYCETFGGKKYCTVMSESQINEKLNALLSSPRMRF